MRLSTALKYILLELAMLMKKDKQFFLIMQYIFYIRQQNML